MAKDSKSQNTSETLLAELATAVAALTNQVQNLQQSVQQGGQQNTQQSAATQLLNDLASKVATSSSRDTDINAEEAMKSYSPVWGLNGKLILAQELHSIEIARNQAQQIIQNAINTSNIVQNDAANALGVRLLASNKIAQALGNHPTYFAENAPASQDTGGEGDDTGDKGQEDNG